MDFRNLILSKMKTIVLFFSFLLSSLSVGFAQDVPTLLKQGKALLDQNKTNEAIGCFEKVLLQDPKNYDALVYLCNFYFLSGLQVLDTIETAYLVRESPTRMQFAQHSEDLKKVYRAYYSKAEHYLIQAYLIRRNDHLDDLAGQIADFKERIGIFTPGTNKARFKRTLLP